MTVRRSGSEIRVLKQALLLPLAFAVSVSWAQTVTYGVPTSSAVTTIPVTVKTTMTTTACQPPGVNGTTTSSQPGTLAVLPPWHLEDAEKDASGEVALIGSPADALPPRLQPSSVLVVTDGVSQSAGQSFVGPSHTAYVEQGVSYNWNVTYNYGASVTGTSFSETFKGVQNTLAGAEQNGLSANYANNSTFDVTTAKQVLSLNQTANFVNYDSNPYCTTNTTVVATGTDTLTWNTAPAIQVATMLPTATVGVPYSARLVTGGSPAGGPYTLVVNNLPSGLQANPDGTVTGTPTGLDSGTQTYSLTVNASDGSEHDPLATSQLTLAAVPDTCQPPAPAALPAGESWYQLDSVWSNLPYDNQQSTHSETGAQQTIGDRGGLLTALAYMLSSAGVPYTPATLDTVIGQHAADFSWALTGRANDGGSISIGTAVLDASLAYPSSTSAGLLFGRDVLGSQSTTDLDNYLCKTRVPVLLQVNDPGSNARHYVVATQKASDGYHIVDPGFQGRSNLSAYGGKFRIQGALTPRNAILPGSGATKPTQTELNFNIVDGATLAVTTASGQQTGVIGSTANAPLKGSSDAGYLAIDNASDTDAGSIAPSSTTYTVQMDADVFPTGQNPTYTVQVSGLHTGIYYLTIKATGALNVVSSAPGIGANGSTATYLLTLDDAHNTMHLWLRASWTTAMQDVTNGSALGTYGSTEANTLQGYLNAAKAAASFTDATHKAQFAAALNAFIAKVNTFHSPDVIKVLAGDANALLAGPDYP